MHIKKDEVQYFINQETLYAPKKTIKSSLILVLLLGIPTAIFGVYSSITRVVMLPIIVAFCIWVIFLLKNSINQNKFNLFTATYALLVSLSCLILAYKLYVSNNHEVAPKITCLILGLYFICIAVKIIIVIQLIKKGYYKQPKKQKNIQGLIWIVAVTGIICGKKILGTIDPKLLDNVMLLGLVLFSFLGACGTTGFLKYYLAKKVES